MSRNRVFVALAVITAVSVLGAVSAAGSERRPRGGFVIPCSLVGVNPVLHPDIFGNPAVAKAYYGFVQGRDRTWHVQDNCHRY
jgi:hypothetical protein